MTIFRINPIIDNADEIVEPQRRPWSVGVPLSDGSIGVLHVKRSLPNTPAWMSFFPDVDFEGINPMSASSSAVLVIRRATGYYAVVFGFGRYLLREGVVDERFGLRVTLNAMDPSLLRSLDHKRLDAVPRHTREQLSKAGVLGQFGLDIERDMLRGLTATPKDRSLGDRLAGTDALTVTGPISLARLPSLLDAYAALAERRDYQAVFPWVDNIAEISDSRLATKLDATVVAALRIGSPKVWLGLPDIVPWPDVAGFAYTRGRNATICDDLSLELYSQECASVADMTLPRLDSDTVRCISAGDGSDLFRWTIRRCLVGEAEFEGDVFVISEGKWFRVSRDFLAQVDREVADIPRRYKGILPRSNGKDEGEYNARAARRGKGVFHLLDTDLVHFPPRGAVEVCDLYDRDRVFVHVKKYGASSVLSHLFSQGGVSAELFYLEPGFRKAVWEKLPAPYQWGDPASQPTQGQFGVCFAIICRPGKGLDLPVFSKINLRREARHLRQLGFDVSIAEIPS